LETQSHGLRPLVIHTDWSRAWGGQEIRILTELRELRKHGFRVSLIVPYESASEDSWMAGAVARLCRVPLIIRTRHVLAPISSALSYNLFPHIIFTCGSAIAERIVAQGVRSEKILVLPSGNDEKRFQFSSKKREEIRSQYGIQSHEILVGNIGFLRHLKGHPFILRTAASMAINFRFMFVGDGGERLVLETMARDLNIEHRVIFTGHQERPEDFLSAFDICFFSSHLEEGVSQSLIQSLLNGLPVLACHLQSNMESLRHIKDYRLVDYNDVPAACRALQELAELPRRNPERMERQHQVIADRYGVQPMMKTLISTYRRFGVTAPS